MKCNYCSSDVDTTSIKTANEDRSPLVLFSKLRCNTCKHNFTAQNINLISWLYPKYSSCGSDNINYDLLCSVCHFHSNEPNLHVSCVFDHIQYKYSTEYYEENCLNLNCSAKWHYDEEYVMNKQKKLLNIFRYNTEHRMLSRALHIWKKNSFL